MLCCLPRRQVRSHIADPGEWQQHAHVRRAGQARGARPGKPRSRHRGGASRSWAGSPACRCGGIQGFREDCGAGHVAEETSRAGRRARAGTAYGRPSRMGHPVGPGRCGGASWDTATGAAEQDETPRRRVTAAKRASTRRSDLVHGGALESARRTKRDRFISTLLAKAYTRG